MSPMVAPLRINHIDSLLMSAAFKRRCKPEINDFKSFFYGEHTLAEGKDVRVIVLAGKPRRSHIPAETATDPMDPVCDDGFAIA